MAIPNRIVTPARFGTSLFYDKYSRITGSPATTEYNLNQSSQGQHFQQKWTKSAPHSTPSHSAWPKMIRDPKV